MSAAGQLFTLSDADRLRAFKATKLERHGVCVTCRSVGFVCGPNQDSVVCQGCFEGVHRGRHPNMRRRAPRQGGKKR